MGWGATVVLVVGLAMVVVTGFVVVVAGAAPQPRARVKPEARKEYGGAGVLKSIW